MRLKRLMAQASKEPGLLASIPNTSILQVSVDSKSDSSNEDISVIKDSKDATTDDQTATQTEPGPAVKKRKMTSDIWRHFQAIGEGMPNSSFFFTFPSFSL